MAQMDFVVQMREQFGTDTLNSVVFVMTMLYAMPYLFGIVRWFFHYDEPFMKIFKHELVIGIGIFITALMILLCVGLIFDERARYSGTIIQGAVIVHLGLFSSLALTGAVSGLIELREKMPRRNN